MRDGDPKFDGRAVIMHLLYDLAFLAAILLTFPYIAYRLATSRRFRAGLVQRLGFVPRRAGSRRAIWVHGVSAGETKTILPILRRIEAAYPDLEWVISTTTLAGYQMAQKLFSGRFIFYFPLDIGFIVRKAIRRVNPGLIILMELEIWPNLLYEAGRWGAPVVIINGRISEKSFRGYRKLKKLLPEMHRISLFSVQNREYRDRLLALDVPPGKIAVTGNLKYDGIDTSEAPDSRAIRGELWLSETDRVLVAGSTHDGEDVILLDLYKAVVGRRPGLRLVLVPRHLERVEDIEKECTRRGFRPIRRTALERKRTVMTRREILILDTIGELDRVYAAADLVFVGGSLVPKGGHNMMEPAGKGKPVLYGPHVFNFSEDASLLESANAAVKVKDEEDLKSWVDRLLEDEQETSRLGREAREVIAKAKGATERNFDLIDRFFLKELVQKQG